MTVAGRLTPSQLILDLYILFRGHTENSIDAVPIHRPSASSADRGMYRLRRGCRGVGRVRVRGVRRRGGRGRERVRVVGEGSCCRHDYRRRSSRIRLEAGSEKVEMVEIAIVQLIF